MRFLRYITDQVSKDLHQKMVFVGGPRQVGKTTFAIHLRPPDEVGYLNWDVAKDRRAILEHRLPAAPLLVLDEIHKYRNWRGYVKGIFDAQKLQQQERQEILVTGSARLDYYRYGGDSLQGRYHYLRLLPLSFREIQGQGFSDLQALFEYSGFPEPFSLQSEVETRRWSNEYTSRLIREDLRDLEAVRDLGNIELLMNRLPDLVGSPLSINSLREDLQVAHKTVEHWLTILERLYALFRIPSIAGNQIRAVKKERKHYFFDWTLNQDQGARFENLMAVHLLKYVYFLQDSQGHKMELRYFRDTDGREVDFVVLKDQKPVLFVECKLKQQAVSPPLLYLQKKYPQVRAYQVHYQGEQNYQTKEGIRVLPATEFLKDFL